MEKKRTNYENTGLVRKDGIVTINGKGFNDLPEKAKSFIANTGLYVWITRLAARSKELTLTQAEMKAEFNDGLTWLMADCPKRTKLATPEKKLAELGLIITEGNETLNNLQSALAVMKDKAGKVILESIITKTTAEVKLAENESTRIMKAVVDKLDVPK